MALPTPYHVVMYRPDGERVTLREFASFLDARDYTTNNVARNPRVMRRIEIRDAFGRECIETVWDFLGRPLVGSNPTGGAP